LGGNKISGHIPAGIGRYYKLRTIEFADNLFTGTIPSDQADQAVGQYWQN
jgi:hypothetical protein